MTIIRGTLVLRTLPLLILTVSFQAYGMGFSTDWYQKVRQVSILHSSRQEIEQLLGNPTIVYSNAGGSNTEVEYDWKGVGRVHVSYSTGKCTPTSKYGYDVAEGVVLNVYVKLKEPVRVSKLRLDLSSYRRSEISDMPGVTEYTNRDIGERYIVEESPGEKPKLMSLSFSPKMELENLACVRE